MSPENQQDPLEALSALGTDPEESEYDQELGRQVGIDAMRVANGELTETEFHEKYDKRLREEFGDDYTPAEVIADE
ncbi:4Fe-4S ferredoxin N-terminal domain-containing protein [Natronoarchaeum sp. GCM10025703]|uniref:4Fe-4S ferredoxin N-terminal domain-containing protein n=1 Tax=unclassified Natronoarchaeum TaxID=2620183 RepID=UPI00361D300A